MPATVSSGNHRLALLPGLSRRDRPVQPAGHTSNAACLLPVLLRGRSLRASLALHFAASRAATTQRPALLLCSRPHMEQQVPLLPFQADVGDASLELIHLK